MSSSLLFQQCPACLVRLTWMVLEIGGKWPYSCCFVDCFFRELFNNNTQSILAKFPLSIFSMRLVSVYMVHPQSSIDSTDFCKKSRFIVSDKLDFYTIDSRSIVVHTFARRIWKLLSVDETLLLRYVNLSTNFRGLLLAVEMASSRFKHMYFVLVAFTGRPMPTAACSRICCRDSAWVGVFSRSSI